MAEASPYKGTTDLEFNARKWEGGLVKMQSQTVEVEKVNMWTQISKVGKVHEDGKPVSQKFLAVRTSF